MYALYNLLFSCIICENGILYCVVVGGHCLYMLCSSVPVPATLLRLVSGGLSNPFNAGFILAHQFDLQL